MARVKVRVEVLSEGIAALMQSAALAAEVDAAASRIASAAGDGFEVLPAEIHGDRAMALVVPEDADAMEAEARDKVLSKAVSACRS